MGRSITGNVFTLLAGVTLGAAIYRLAVGQVELGLVDLAVGLVFAGLAIYYNFLKPSKP